MIKTYSELMEFSTFEERYEYLKTSSGIGTATFGHERFLNQRFYTSLEWRSLRKRILVRDLGCDLGLEDYPIHGNVLIHHINPVRKEQILSRDPMILDPENLITVSHRTHNAIHFGTFDSLPKGLQSRNPGDTKLW